MLVTQRRYIEKAVLSFSLSLSISIWVNVITPLAKRYSIFILEALEALKAHHREMSDSQPSVLQWLRLANRDVSDIWIGCFVTIIASTFLALHLSVRAYNPPTTPESLPKRWWLSRFNHEFRRQILWTLIMVIAPEVMVGLSFGDWRAASVGFHMFKTFGKGQVPNWSKVHASFANMGGLKFKMKTESPDGPQSVIEDDALLEMYKNSGLHNTTFEIIRCFVGIHLKASISPLKKVSKRFAPFLNRIWDRIAILRNKISTARGSRSTPIISSRTAGGGGTIDQVRGELHLYLNAAQIVVAQYLKILDEGPVLDEVAIEDKSKTNPLAKGIAIISLFWFILGIFIQIFQNEELTQLELSTFTYAICAVITYFLYWNKPQSVEVPIEHSVATSDAVRSVTHRDIRILKSFGSSSFLLRNFTPRFGTDNEVAEPSDPTPTDVSLTAFAIVGFGGPGVYLFDADLAGIAMGMVFGAIYCLGWNNIFPSQWEQLAWRISSLTVTASLIPYSIANAICTVIFRSGHSKRRMTHPVHILTLVLLGIIYVACRFFMLFEMIRALIK
ncbi:uncharacterized protein F4812DRAFT_443084 [Daldinia caldariorum]|uniref:uncharacterized protein n=1 Tax=Daldinia caldariorum TaxID=326644 RepID=UPI0020086109|nr:uncharacterized protein F4812DRAFT_443084 [Daldinia caldariorum]KAI1464351.1 hypothetical protein F4812DRAFT_443084 [Daldinia caldariorum]